MKIIAWLAGLGTLLAGAFYLVVSLNRWEWNRALFFGLIVLIAEVGLATGLVPPSCPPRAQPQRPRRPRRRADPQRDQADARRFAWMRESSGQLNVFITFLVGGGVLLSGIAWIVDRRAEDLLTGRRGALGPQLNPISYPSGGLLLDDVTVLAQDVPGADDAQIRQLPRRGGRP